jgi:transposase
MSLLNLNESLQRQVLAGEYGSIPDRTLRSIASLRTKAKQKRALEEHAVTARPMDSKTKPRRLRCTSQLEAQLRLVLYFNPEMFVDQRAQGNRHRQEVEEHVEDLNRKLKRTTKRRSREEVYAEVVGKLDARSLLSVYSIEIREVQHGTRSYFEVRLDFDEEVWAKRRSLDGFVLLVAHPELLQSGVEIVGLYRAKDAVEKDFQTIKTDLKLRPVFHHTDPKVRAHVTLCMLALLLERTLERRLRRAGMPMTAPACLEQLAPGHLNMMTTGPDAEVAYIPTEPNAEQRALLQHLQMSALIDHEEVAAQLRPRVTT